LAHVTEDAQSADQNNYTIPSVYLKSGWPYYLVVENSHGSDASAISAITGGGTWTSRSTVQFNGTLNRVSIWSCIPTADYVGTINVAFGGVTQTGMCSSISLGTGVDTTTNHGVVQQATGTGNSTTPLATLSAFGSSDNVGFLGVGVNNNSAMGPVTAATSEISDLGAATPEKQGAFFSYNDTTLDCTVTTGQWGACGLELKADTSPVWIPAGQYYMGIQCNGGTALFFRKINWSEVSSLYIHSTGGLIFSKEAPTAGSGLGTHPLFGFTRRVSP
jgi:hypothetical protein